MSREGVDRSLCLLDQQCQLWIRIPLALANPCSRNPISLMRLLVSLMIPNNGGCRGGRPGAG